jgi:predicted AAA+ superfamily ATPase
MALPAWWQVATPHKDIREKNFSESIFAADLGDVVGGNAPAEYLDPRLFFSKTFLTEGLKKLVKNVLSRLADGHGDPVVHLQPQTPFGGGKTHSLLCLYHLGKSFLEINHLEQVKELGSFFPAFCGAKVAAFVGTSADPVAGRTPWGEIAYQLGCYDIVKEHDMRRVAPGKERIRDILKKSGPALILIDELLQYIVKASRIEKLEKITHGQTLSFLQELSEAVAVSEKCALVLALPRGFLYTLAKLLGDFQAVSSGSPQKMGKRVTRRVARKATGRAFRKLFK